MIVNLDSKNTPWPIFLDGNLDEMSFLPTAKLTPTVVIDPREVVAKQKGITNLYASLDVTRQQSKLNLQWVWPFRAGLLKWRYMGFTLKFWSFEIIKNDNIWLIIWENCYWICNQKYIVLYCLCILWKLTCVFLFSLFPSSALKNTPSNSAFPKMLQRMRSRVKWYWIFITLCPPFIL